MYAWPIDRPYLPWHGVEKEIHGSGWPTNRNGIMYEIFLILRRDLGEGFVASKFRRTDLDGYALGPR